MSKFIKAEDVNLSDVGIANERRTDIEIFYDEFVGVTPDAALFIIDEEEHWFPRSTIYQTYEEAVIIREWVAIQEGLV